MNKIQFTIEQDEKGLKLQVNLYPYSKSDYKKSHDLIIDFLQNLSNVLDNEE